MKIVRVIIGATLAAFLFAGGGCAEPTIKSPYSGQQVDAPTLAIEARSAAEAVAAEAESDAQAEREKLAAARALFDDETANIESVTVAQVNQLSRQYEQTASAATAAVERIARKAQAGINKVESIHAAAAAALERERAQQNMLLEGFQAVTGSPLAQTGASAIPGGPLALAALTGLGAWFARRSVHKAEDKGWDGREAALNAGTVAAELAELRARVASLPTPPTTGATT